MLKISIKSIFFLILFCFQPEIYGQILPFQNYSIKDGVISINIHSLCEDSLGYIWIGTEEGISVFNSREFVNYTTANGLSSNNISCITADVKIRGKVWIATYDSGIDVYENGGFKNLGSRLPNGLKNVNVLCQDENGTLWCGSDSGLFYIKNNSIKVINNSSKMGSINSIIESNKSLWIGSEKGLYVFNKTDRSVKRINVSGEKYKSGISCLFSAGNYIWAGSESGLIYKIKPDEKIVQDYNLRQQPFSIASDRLGNIWVGTGKGLFMINTRLPSQKEIKRVRMGSSSDENIITSLLVDRENILWCGSNANGLSKLVYRNFFRFPIPSELSMSNWSSAISDKNNHFWVSVKNKLIELWADKNGQWHWEIHSINNHASPPIQKIFCDVENNLYVAYLKGIVKIYSIKNTNSAFRPSKLKLQKDISLGAVKKYFGLYTILIDSRGLMWCSLLDAGVAVWDIRKNKLLKFYSDKTGLPDNSVRSIYEDSRSNYWFGGYDHGLSEFSKDKILRDLYAMRGNNVSIKYFTVNSGLPDNHVRSVIENNEHDIVAGTRYGGIAFIKNGNIKSFDRNDGLISNGVWELTKDPAGNIWFGSQSGIQEINNNNEIVNFLLIEDIPRIPYYSICSSQNGNICFINNTDIYLYRPRLNTIIREQLPIYVNHILVNGQERKISNSLSLPSFNNTVTFEFICITNREEKNIHYLYRLLQIDNNWTPVKGKPSVTFASLNPGRYIFQVIAEDNRSLKSRHPAEIDFIIDAPFYLHWWFIGFLLAAVITGILTFSKLKFNRLLEIEKIRTGIAADLHDEIGSGLTRIAILSEHALQKEKEHDGDGEDKNEKYSKYISMERVGKISRSLVDSMIDVIWSIDPKYDSLSDFIFNFKNYANEVCEAKNIKLVIETDNIENVKVNSQIKRSLQLISKEALNNSLKYSGCANVKYSLSVKNKNIHVILEDDGIGFDRENIKHGRGLVNISKHAKELSGIFNLNAVPGNGTKISVVFPVKS